MTESPPSESPAGDRPSENGERPTQNVRKPTDIKGVKEGTAEYAAVDLILKVDQGIAEGLKSLISEDANGFLRDLRADDPTKALADAKEIFGQVQPVNSRLVDRDTVVTFRNNKEKILQIYVRKVQGEYVVREVRVRDAEKTAPRRNG